MRSSWKSTWPRHCALVASGGYNTGYTAGDSASEPFAPESAPCPASSADVGVEDVLQLCVLHFRHLHQTQGFKVLIIHLLSYSFSKFIYMVYYIDSFSYVEPSLHLWDKAYLIMVDSVFVVILKSVCQDFIEHFCIDVHEGD
ncbi:hypothetical protein STEG23_027120 [Scotinomys teguina]